jgi:hypothetical protein
MPGNSIDSNWHRLCISKIIIPFSIPEASKKIKQGMAFLSVHKNI